MGKYGLKIFLHTFVSSLVLGFNQPCVKKIELVANNLAARCVNGRGLVTFKVS